MAKDTFLNRKVTLNSKGKLIDLSRPAVMAILNLTPDSFHKESRSLPAFPPTLSTQAFTHL